MKKIILFTFIAALVISCKEDPIDTQHFELDTSNGVFIACEGNFMSGNGSLSFYNTEEQEVSNRVFYARNNVPLGDVVNSLARHNNDLYIVVNNSGKVVVVDASTVEYKGDITGLSSPRYVHFVSEEKAYISDIMDDNLVVFNPETLEEIGSVDLDGHTIERMIQVGQYIYATNWSFGKKLLVIDTTTDELISEIELPLQPKDLVIDKNGKLWVLSDGGFEGSPVGHEEPAISRINIESETVEQIYKFELDDFPSQLRINGTRDTLYYINNHVFKMPIDGSTLPDTEFLNNENELFYNLAIDPAKGDLYITNAIDYTQDAIIYRYTKGGTLIDTFKAGINPADFKFR